MKDSSQFLIGADVIALMIKAQHPMIMVDRIIDYTTSQQQMYGKCYVSANDPVFTGHFPNLKLWPGIHTIEGLRQCCELHMVLIQLEKGNLLDGIIALQNRQRLQPNIDKDLCKRVLQTLKDINNQEPSSVTLRIKLLAPVFAGCVINYQVQLMSNEQKWSVEAQVNGQKVAKGEIIIQK